MISWLGASSITASMWFGSVVVRYGDNIQSIIYAFHEEVLRIEIKLTRYVGHRMSM